MPQMTPRQARVVDPLLTAIARGFEPETSLVGDLLFPVVQCDSRTGQLVVFGNEAFQVQSTKRAPGTNVPRTQISYGSDKFVLADHGLDAQVPVEIGQEAQQVGIDMAANSVFAVQNKLALEREKEAAVLSQTADNYPTSNKTTLSGSNQWSHADSNPFAVVDAGKKAVRAKIGRRPNLMVVGPNVLSALRNHPKVLDRLSTASDRAPATVQQLQALFEVDQIVEGVATENTGSDTWADLWGNNAVLAYTVPKSLAQRGSMCYGYTYQLAGMPQVGQGYWDSSVRSMVYPVDECYSRYLVGNIAGYLITDAVAA